MKRELITALAVCLLSGCATAPPAEPEPAPRAALVEKAKPSEPIDWDKTDLTGEKMNAFLINMHCEPNREDGTPFAYIGDVFSSLMEATNKDDVLFAVRGAVMCQHMRLNRIEDQLGIQDPSIEDRTKAFKARGEK